MAAFHCCFCLISDEGFEFANADGRNLFVLQQFCSRLVCLPPGTFGSHQSFVLPALTARRINISRKLIVRKGLPPSPRWRPTSFLEK